MFWYVALAVLTAVGAFVGAFVGGGGLSSMRANRRYRREALEKMRGDR